MPRAGQPKVRTGCMTCKVRHVKCDETKPTCLRCKRYGIDCAGYPIRRSSTKNSRKNLLLLPRKPAAGTELQLPYMVPEMQSRTSEIKSDDSIKQCSVSGEILSLSRMPFPFQLTETQGWYFQVFCEKTSMKLGGFWDVELWNRLILQESYQEAYARHAIIALGALDKAKTFLPGHHSDQYFDDQVRLHEQHAVHEYSRSLNLMKNATHVGQGDALRRALLASLLIICFEVVDGDIDTATSQARLGIRLLSQWLRNWKTFKQGSVSESMRLPRPPMIDDVILSAYNRIYKAVLVFRDPQPAGLDTFSRNVIDKNLPPMPKVFSCIEEARKYWEAQVNHVLPWNQTPGHDNLTAASYAKIFPDVISGETHYIRNQQSISEIQSQCRAYLKFLDRFNDAFYPIFQRSRTPSMNRERFQANVLRMHWHIGMISFPAANSPTELIYDEFLPNFTEMINLLQQMLEDTSGLPTFNFEENFTFGPGMITSLYVIVVKCRIRKLRRQALELLERYPRREGVWDTGLALAVGRWLMSVEEYGLGSDEIIPESSRLRLRSVKTLPASNREAIINCTKMTELGNSRIRTMVPQKRITW